MEKRPYLSIVIPAYNEEDRLPPTLKKILQYFKKQKYSWEIIVIDDGSRDKTSQVVKNFIKDNKNIRLVRQKNTGKGGAVKNGILHCWGEYVLMTDADLSTPIEELKKFWPKIKKGCSIVTGSRGVRGAKILRHQKPIRELFGKIFGGLSRLLVLDDLIDTQCGFKLFKGDLARKIFQKLWTKSAIWELEIFYHATKEGAKIAEVPVVWIHDQQTRIPYNLQKAVGIFTELLKIKWRYKIWSPVKVRK